MKKKTAFNLHKLFLYTLFVILIFIMPSFIRIWIITILAFMQCESIASSIVIYFEKRRTTDLVKKAYEEGVEAFKNDVSFTDNPYLKECETMLQVGSWLSGWIDAKEQNKS